MKKQVVFGSSSARRRSTLRIDDVGHCQAQLQDLDEGVLGRILVHLDVTSICALACTCKDLSVTVFQPENVWRQKLIECLPYTPAFMPHKAKRGHKWCDVVRHVVVSLKGPSDKMVRAAVRDTARPVVGGSRPLVVGAQTPGAGGGQSIYYRGAATTRNAFYAEPDISVNPMLAWNHKAQVKDAFLLSCPEKAPPSRQRAAGNACGAACVRSAFPFSHCSTSVIGVPTIRYMEIDITNLGSRSKIAMGVVHGQQAMQWMRSGSHLGTDSGPWEGSLDSIGWHIHSGVIYPDKEDVRWHARGAEFAPPVAAPAVLGCGMDILGNSLFYTLNGAVIGVVLPSAREHDPSRTQAQNVPDDGDQEHQQELEAVPANAQQRFLDSLLSLRRSGRFTTDDFDVESAPDLLSVLSKCGEEAQTSVVRNSLVVAPPAAAGAMKEHEVHPIDVAHCIFAVSISGGAAADFNLGQRKFQFDLGGLFASAAASRSGSMGGALSFGGSVASQGLNAQSHAGSVSAANWRVSLGGCSARSNRSLGGWSLFEADKGGRSDDREVGFRSRLPSSTGSADTFVSCRTTVTRAGEGTFKDYAAESEDKEGGLQVVGSVESGQGVQDRSYWRVLSINDGSELHEAVTGANKEASQEAEDVGILKWLGWA